MILKKDLKNIFEIFTKTQFQPAAISKNYLKPGLFFSELY